MRGPFLGATTGPGGLRCASAGSEISSAGRHFLTDANLRLLPTRDGIPHRRYGRHGVLAVSGNATNLEGQRLAGLRRHFEHTLSVNSFVVALATEATALRPRVQNHRLVHWLSAAKAQECFRWGAARCRLLVVPTTPAAECHIAEVIQSAAGMAPGLSLAYLRSADYVEHAEALGDCMAAGRRQRSGDPVVLTDGVGPVRGSKHKGGRNDVQFSPE